MRTLLTVLIACVAATAQVPDAPSATRYPHAMFVLEATTLSVAIEEVGRARTSYEYYTPDGREYRHSTGRYLALNIPIGIAATAAAWKLERSTRKPLRIVGHVLMWSAIAAYSTDYFKEGR